MSNYISNGTDTISAGKFVERKQKSIDVPKIKRIAQSIYSSNLSAQLNEISKITSDNVITSSEKKDLLEEWNYIQAAFSSTTSYISQMEQLESEEYIALESAYDDLKKAIEPILKDMQSDTEISDDVYKYFEKYSSASDVLNIYINLINNNILKDISDIGLRVSTNKNEIEPGEDAIFRAEIFFYENGIGTLIPENIKNLYIDDDGLYRALYKWNFKGTNDDDYWNEYAQGREYVTIPSSSFAGESVTAYFNSEIIVGE